MGDVGSAFLGYSFAVLPVIAAPRNPRVVVAGALVVWPFLFDSSFTFLGRLSRGENVFAAHRSHLYQRLIIVGYSHRWVSSLYIGLAVAGVVLAAGYLTQGPGMQVAIAEGELRIAELRIAVKQRAERNVELRIAVRARGMSNCELRIAVRNVECRMSKGLQELSADVTDFADISIERKSRPNSQFEIRNPKFPFWL